MRASQYKSATAKKRQSQSPLRTSAVKQLPKKGGNVEHSNHATSDLPAPYQPVAMLNDKTMTYGSNDLPFKSK